MLVASIRAGGGTRSSIFVSAACEYFNQASRPLAADVHTFGSSNSDGSDATEANQQLLRRRSRSGKDI